MWPGDNITTADDRCSDDLEAVSQWRTKNVPASMVTLKIVGVVCRFNFTADECEVSVLFNSLPLYDILRPYWLLLLVHDAHSIRIRTTNGGALDFRRKRPGFDPVAQANWFFSQARDIIGIARWSISLKILTGPRPHHCPSTISDGASQFIFLPYTFLRAYLSFVWMLIESTLQKHHLPKRLADKSVFDVL